jgi:carboxymethylenebutenolidase
MPGIAIIAVGLVLMQAQDYRAAISRAIHNPMFAIRSKRIRIRAPQTALMAACVLAILLVPLALARQPNAPETIIIRSANVYLHALLWRPIGKGPFPAVLFNHGSYGRGDVLTPEQATVLGTEFAKHGYAFLFLFRRGVGLSADQGPPEGELMNQAFSKDGSRGRNRTQLELLDGESMVEARAGLDFLRHRPDIDHGRIAIAGHSFGGSLSLLLAASEPVVHAVLLFGSTARSWDRSPDLRARLLTAARTTGVPVLFIHAANDYSTAPGTALAAERQKLGLPQRLRIYPAFGSTASEGHNFLYSSPGTWESDVFAFLGQSLNSAKPIAHVSPP